MAMPIDAGEAAAPGLGWKLVILGFVLIVVGMAAVVVGTLLEAARSGRGEVGGVVIIGPFPIVWGSSPGAAKTAALLGIVLLVLAVLVFLLPVLLARRVPGQP